MSARIHTSLTSWVALLVILSGSALAKAQSEPNVSDRPAEMLTILIAPEIPRRGSYSTKTNQEQQLRVVSGRTVTLSQSSGRDYQMNASGGFYWTQVEQVPRKQDSIALSPTRQEDGSVLIDIQVFGKQGSDIQSFSSTVVAQPGEWLQVYGDIGESDVSRTTYSTRHENARNLYLKVLQ